MSDDKKPLRPPEGMSPYLWEAKARDTKTIRLK